MNRYVRIEINRLIVGAINARDVVTNIIAVLMDIILSTAIKSDRIDPV